MYAPETGTFLSRDPAESKPPYQYVRENLVNLSDVAESELDRVFAVIHHLCLYPKFTINY